MQRPSVASRTTSWTFWCTAAYRSWRYGMAAPRRLRFRGARAPTPQRRIPTWKLPSVGRRSNHPAVVISTSNRDTVLIGSSARWATSESVRFRRSSAKTSRIAASLLATLRPAGPVVRAILPHLRRHEPPFSGRDDEDSDGILWRSGRLRTTAQKPLDEVVRSSRGTSGHSPRPALFPTQREPT